MSAFDAGFLSLVIASFGLFAVVLGGAAWYCRDNPAKPDEQATEATKGR